MSPRARFIVLLADPDADDCLAEAVARCVRADPDLAGWDISPRWDTREGDLRERIILEVPTWAQLPAGAEVAP